MTTVDQIIQDISKLPPFPEVAQKVLSLLDDPKSDVRDLVEVIRLDQAMTANILKFCNSAYFGLQRQVGSLQEALVLIGLKNLYEVFMTECAGTYYQTAGVGYSLEQGELWRHSVASALVSQILIRRAGLPQNPSVFTAALLHDIGKVVLSARVKDAYSQIVALVEGQNCTFLEAERQAIGIDHATLGALIVKAWNFPQPLVDAIERHHLPDADDYVASIVHLSNLMTVMMGIGTGYGLAEHARAEAMTMLGLDEGHLESCMAELPGELERAEGLLKV